MAKPEVARQSTQDLVLSQCNTLWDVVAVLEAAQEVTPNAGDTADEDQVNRMRRLMRVAEGTVRNVIADFDAGCESK